MDDQTVYTGNREAWLTALAERVAPRFVEIGHPLPAVRLTCGWPITGGRPGGRNTTIGQCFGPKMSADETSEIFISPWLADDTVKIAEVVTHELTHAAVGVKAGHKGPFVTAIRKLDLGGKPTATEPTEAFEAWVRPILDDLGPYPHAKIDPSARTKQTTRQMRVYCPDCEQEGEPYLVRMSRKTIERGTPLCPIHNEPMIAEVI